MPLSYARGPEVRLLEWTLFEALEERRRGNPRGEALVVRHEGRRWTWEALAEEVERTARGLVGLGLRPGDRVGMWATNCSEWVLLQLACARTGVVLVNVNPAYRASELAYVLRKSHMKVIFLREADARTSYRATLEDTGRSVRSVFLGTEDWEEMLANGREVKDVAVSPYDVANIQYTSGTTGSPKGVLLTHHNILNNGLLIGRMLRATEADRICVPVPMYHCFGCVGGTCVSLTTGAPMILPSATFEAGAVLEAIAEERATAIYGVPTMFIAMLEHAGFAGFDLTSLRTGIMAGSPCPIEVMKQVVERMHCPQMTIMYGQTEASPVITGSDAESPLETRVETVGTVYPNTEVKITNTLNETVEVGQQGELCARGYLIMKGYDEEPEATARAIDAEGWLHTGDLAVMREDGHFKITGRIKDMIIRGGENIYPREIEEFLYTHPKVADVQVVGLPDRKLGETVAAWIRLKAGETATEEEIREWCRMQIAHFKIPQYIRFVESFPLTVTGKIQKFKIREQEIERQGLQEAARIQTA